MTNAECKKYEKMTETYRELEMKLTIYDRLCKKLGVGTFNRLTFVDDDGNCENMLIDKELRIGLKLTFEAQMRRLNKEMEEL